MVPIVCRNVCQPTPVIPTFTNAGWIFRLSDLEGSRKQLQAATKLQPEMENLRVQLEQATSDIQKQQWVISDSEDFVKGVFASHQVASSPLGCLPKIDTESLLKHQWNRDCALTSQRDPIQNTIQMQYHVCAVAGLEQLLELISAKFLRIAMSGCQRR